MSRLQIHTYEPDVSMDAAVPEYLNSPCRGNMNSKDYYRSSRDLCVLWLLHDAEGSSSDWFRYTQAELFSQEQGFIIVCPNGENGFWTNMVRGVGWSDMFAIKIWSMVHKMLPTSDGRRKNYIAGIGMGGYGAIKLALENPEFFAGAAAFDGWLDAPDRVHDNSGYYPGKWHLEDVFGDRYNPDTDLFRLMEQVKTSGDVLPEFYIDCDDNSDYADVNHRFVLEACKCGYSVESHFDTSGTGWRRANNQLELMINRRVWE